MSESTISTRAPAESDRSGGYNHPDARLPRAWQTDLCWLLLMLGTAVMWWIFDSRQSGESSVLPLTLVMLGKSVLIGAVFMNLWNASKVTLALLGLAFASIAAGVIASLAFR